MTSDVGEQLTPEAVELLPSFRTETDCGIYKCPRCKKMQPGDKIVFVPEDIWSLPYEGRVIAAKGFRRFESERTGVCLPCAVIMSNPDPIIGPIQIYSFWKWIGGLIKL